MSPVTSLYCTLLLVSVAGPLGAVDISSLPGRVKTLIKLTKINVVTICQHIKLLRYY